MPANVPMVILSHQRARFMTTHKHVHGCSLCIPQSQVAEYQAEHPDLPIIAHPDSIIGISAKRQWVLDYFDGECFQFDDDVTGALRLYREPGAKQPSYIPPDLVQEIVNSTAETARQLKTHLFTFSIAIRPLAFKPGRPFSFIPRIYSLAFGILRGSRLYFPDLRYCREDWFVSLLNAHYSRIALRDNRFSFITPVITPGGLQEIRENYQTGVDVDREALIHLRKSFGPVITAVAPGKSGRRAQSATLAENMPHLNLPYYVAR